MAFLQAEYSAFVVNSTFNAETSRLFRSFENNASAFSESSLRNIRVAAELSSINELLLSGIATEEVILKEVREAVGTHQEFLLPWELEQSINQ